MALKSPSQSHIASDGQAVSQSVSLGMTRYLLLFDSHGRLCGVLSDEMAGLSFVRAIVYSNKSLVILYKIFTILYVIHGNRCIYSMYRACVRP
jgi:hypothetical protein